MEELMPRTRITRDRRGHPDQYCADYARMAQVHCRLGATDVELADLFGVNTKTIHNWMSKHKEFAEAVRTGMLQVFSPRVVRSLAQRAIGYAIDTEEAKVMRDGSVIRYGLRKHYPPDVTACIFWLKNRDPENWRDVQDHILKHQNLDKLTSRELLDEIRQEAAELGILPEQLPRANAEGTRSRH
jgi:hypothetical protein